MDRDTFVNKLHKMLDELNEQIGILQEKMKKTTDEAKIKYQPELEKLKGLRDDIEKRINESRTSGALKDILDGAEKAVQELRNALKNAAGRF